MLLALAALVTIFCGLVAVLLLYNHWQAAKADRCPQANERKVLWWLEERGLRLPDPEEILALLQPSIKKLQPLEEGIQWQDLRVERLLPNTKPPEIQITSIKSMDHQKVVLDCLVQWSECMPGLEVTVKVGEEVVTCHLQVDWIIMQGIAELKESTADESLVISWRQTQHQRSGLSCMAVHPSHWTISIDALPSEDERTEKCEELASAVAEAFHRVLAELTLDKVLIPVKPSQPEDKQDHSLPSSPVEDLSETSSEVPPKRTLPEEEEKNTAESEDSGNATTETEAVQKHEDKPAIQIEESPPATSEPAAPTEESVPSIEQAPEPLAPDTEQNGNESVPTTIPPPQEAESLDQVEEAPQPDQDTVATSNQDTLDEEQKEDENELSDESSLSSNHQSPLHSPFAKRTPSWRRTPSYEQLETLPALDRVLSLPATPMNHRDSSFPNSLSLSMRSYDSRSTLDDMLAPDGSRIPSTLVFEVPNGTSHRYIAALTATQARQLKKEHSSYTKLHIYNDHTFTATHIKNRLLCVVCKEKISGMFGKQCYSCRDCHLTVHKQCHYKVELACTKRTFVNWKIEYPDDHLPSTPSFH